MHVLILQPVADAKTRRRPYRHEVALLGAALEAHGHTVRLLVLDASDESRRAGTAAISETLPGAVALYVESLAADLARQLAAQIRTVADAPLLAFGPHARLCPDEALSAGGIEAVAVGPADRSIPAYLEETSPGLEHLKTPGLWVKCASGIMRNPPPPPPESLADEPAPARDLYLSDLVLDAAGFAEVRVARGGEAQPEAPPTAVSAAAWPVLHRPVAAVLDEMHALAEEHLDLGGFRLGNRRWISAAAWLAEFADAYRRDVGLPLRTTLEPADVTDETAALLARAGCEEVLMEVGSGSTLIRSDILGLDASAETLRAAFAALRRARVPTAARVEIGAPYETPVSLEETLALLKRLDPDRVEAALHWPSPGTRAYAAAQENGWLVGDPAAAYRAGRPALALPSLSDDDLITALEAIPYAVHRPRLAALIRLMRRAKIRRGRTLHELVLKPFLGPPVRR